MEQQVDVKIDLTLSINAKYSKDEIKKIINKSIVKGFNKRLQQANFKFKEEAEIYGNNGRFK